MFNKIGTDNTPIMVKGLLGKKTISALDTTPVLVYTLASNKSYSAAFINILNIDTITADVTIWVSNTNILLDVDLIEKGVLLSPTSLFTRSVVRLTAGESIYVISTAKIVARIEGYEGVTL